MSFPPFRPASAILFALTVLAVVPPSFAWLRVPYEDAEVVGRSELIVVGRLKAGSIERVPHPRKENEGASWEHHAVLIVDEVLKGKVVVKEMPVVIHYGLDPVRDGRAAREPPDEPRGGGPATKDDGAKRIDIVDNGGHGGTVLADAGRPALWFLRRLEGRRGDKPGDGDFGIVDPPDLAPAVLKDYYRCYLSDDPEKAVRAFLVADAGRAGEDVAARCVRYLTHRQVGRILKVEDPAARAEQLLPYFAGRAPWGLQNEAREGLIKISPAAGPYLLGLYQEARDPNLRDDIISMWGRIKYAGCVPTLIDALEAADRYWAAEQPRLEKGWWNRDVDSPVTERRRREYGTVYQAVWALSEVGDPAARDLVERTRRRWAAINFENSQIVEACDKALKAFDRRAAETRPERPAAD